MTASNAATVGGFVIRLLEAYGVDIVFGMPGVHTLELYCGLEGASIRHVLVRHEQGAGFAADGYARVTGKPGVCLLISGPGVTNAATPMGEAYSDSVPMIVISSTCSSDSLGQGWGRLHDPHGAALAAGLSAGDPGGAKQSGPSICRPLG